MQLTFFQKSIDDASRSRSDKVRGYIQSLPDSDFDGADGDQVCELISAKFRFPDMPEFASGKIEYDQPVFTRGSDRVSVSVYFPCKGDVSLFVLYHRSRPLSPPPPTFEIDGVTLVKVYDLNKQDVDALDRLVDVDIRLVEEYVKSVRDAIPAFNESLMNVTREAWGQRIRELNENKQAADRLSQSRMTLRRRSDEGHNVVLPIQRKPLAVTQSRSAVDPVREYVLGINEYDDILKTVSSMVAVMERTPSAFAQMNEEALRTMLLVALNGIYEGQASSETFNGRGKTDILIRRGDRNVFIAECLMWKGQAYLQKKMNEQLFQYAMWRDSKLALIVFNRGGNFTHTVETMRSTVKAHPQCVNQMSCGHETGARYVFRRHDDAARHFLLTALAFDVPSEA